MVSVRNVSQDRRLEEQLRHTEKMVALGELVAGVAHEINNPLTGISAFAQLLLEEALGDDQRESIQLIKQESDRAKTVIKDLLLFARTTERGAGPVDINEVIEQTAMVGRDERRLVIRTRREDDRVIVTAADTGVGMTADVRRRIFEPFYSTKPAGGGTGLGLSVTYGIIHAHDGTISVESEPDVGSTVTIVLPAMPSDRI